MSKPLPPAVFLMGPTASGKTGVAAALAKRFPFEIISVDSALVYRGMDIGTAKPDAVLLQAAPHRLIDIRDPADSYSAAEFREAALREMAGITAQGNIPLLVGGTMLYFRALEQGLSALPPANPEVRAALEQELLEAGLESLYQRLQQVDPLAAARIHANDPQRIQRALEVYEVTGQPLSDFHAQGREEPLPYRLIKVILAPEDRVWVQQRIERRFREMLEAGLVDEVKELIKRGDLDADVPAMRAVGYRQVRAFLAGRLSYDEMVNQAIVATRQYAKRQLTWLRREENARWFAAEDVSVAERIGEYLEYCLKQ
ncbi:MAG: tRNA (adenosine(37)-N6)-dimethylallyltransferase MiaA [Gammaproteobacteria bacterium]|nr:tRNA (adenosine(37)-N6)-dimethylallyltransferase MiaA [Gammaproteobacteria bacterium]